MVASTSSTRRKVAIGSFTYTANLAANTLSASAALAFGGFGFTAPPTISVGNVINKNGDYYKVQVIIDDVTATTGVVRLFNPTNAPISISGATWQLILVGPY